VGKDYYKILEVEKGANKDEIKNAFRKKAHEFHPDKAGGNEEKFKEVNEAYQVLSDEQKRQQYDQFGTTFDNAGAGGGFEGFQGFGGQGFNVNFEDLGDMFGDFFGGGRSRRGEMHGTDIQVDLELTFKESVFGTEKEINLTKNNNCERCGGVGAEPGSIMKTCSTCDGTGMQTKIQRTILGAMQTRVACADCSGNGETPETLCKDCSGSGIVYEKKSIKIDVPAGVESGMKIRVRGQGESIGAKGQAGNLYVHLYITPDPRFERDQNTIYSTHKIGFTQAALGCEVMTDTIDGKVKLKIPAGTQGGDKLRLKGKGVANGRARGDQIVIIQVVTPTKLSRKEKELLQELDLEE